MWSQMSCVTFTPTYWISFVLCYSFFLRAFRTLLACSWALACGALLAQLALSQMHLHWHNQIQPPPSLLTLFWSLELSPSFFAQSKCLSSSWLPKKSKQWTYQSIGWRGGGGKYGCGMIILVVGCVKKSQTVNLSINLIKTIVAAQGTQGRGDLNQVELPKMQYKDGTNCLLEMFLCFMAFLWSWEQRWLSGSVPLNTSNLPVPILVSCSLVFYTCDQCSCFRY